MTEADLVNCSASITGATAGLQVAMMNTVFIWMPLANFRLFYSTLHKIKANMLISPQGTDGYHDFWPHLMLPYAALRLI